MPNLSVQNPGPNGRSAPAGGIRLDGATDIYAGSGDRQAQPSGRSTWLNGARSDRLLGQLPGRG